MEISRLVRPRLVVVCFALLTACSNSPTSQGTGSAGAPAGSAGASGSAGGSGNAGASGSAGGSGSAGVSGSAGGGGHAGGGAAGVSGSAGGSAGGGGHAGGGAAGAAGGGGTAGGGGSGTAGATTTDGGSADGSHATASEGCGVATTQALGSYVKYMETVTGAIAKQAARNFYVWLPTDYDNHTAYPTVFIGPGCGSNGMQGIQIQKASGNKAIVIGLDPSPTVDPEMRQCFDSQTYPNPEILYFDETVKQVEAKFCVDKSKLFVGGFSSGSWLSDLLGCQRGNVIKSEGNASGCWQGNVPASACTGPIPVILTDDQGDTTNDFTKCGVFNRDRMLKVNGCTTVTEPYDPGIPTPPSCGAQTATRTCVIYKQCTSGAPVVWCTTTGLGHNDQQCTGLSTFGFWNFWMSLP